MKLTELVEALVARGVEVEEPNPVVRVLVDGPRGLEWFQVERVFVDNADESVIVVAGLTAGDVEQSTELEHWD